MDTLDFERNPYPPAERLPVNSSEGKVYPWAWAELEAGDSLVLTGFSSLEFLVETLAALPPGRRVRLLIGQEPVLRRPLKSGARPDLSAEVRAYWLEQGFSILSGAAVLNVVARLDREELSFRLLDDLHAKILVGPRAALLGSSNFSQSGLRLLKEANVRRLQGSRAYGEIRQLGELYWDQGRPAQAEFRDLFLTLLRAATWQEVLALAGAWLLEGGWLGQIPELARRFQDLALWESQKQALSQSLYLLDTYGDSLLIADPTGSGKTRLGAGLHILLLLRLFSQGQSDRTRTLIVTPPQVKPTWEGEFASLQANQPEVLSQGMLSRPDLDEAFGEILRGCRILFLDEAHNYLNHRSNRSTSLLGHGADHTVLFTATPINRRVEDLFRVLSLMDPDNLSDRALQIFQEWNRRRKPLSSGALKDLRRQLSLFTVRRTKADLNRFIHRNPAGYTRQRRLPDGRTVTIPCRYPKTLSVTYKLDESDEDVRLAKQIEDLAWNLKGLIYLRSLTAPPEALRNTETQTRFLNDRLKAAGALAAWNIKAMLRSSRAALIEHIEGTSRAAGDFGLPLEGRRSGDVLSTLSRHRFPLPRHKLSIPLPDWMADPVLREKTLQQELSLYQQIADLARQISSRRERAKAERLLAQVRQHGRVLAFDSRVISLHHLEALLKQIDPAVKVLMVTGGQKEQQRQARHLFGLDSQAEGWIGLCSDAMAEGVNLQGACSLTLLDMPSVMRLAEQRIGRIDRMNSPYESIEIGWPDDHPSFALRTDKKFFLTADSVKNLLGSNIEIPDTLTSRTHLQPVTGSTAVALWEESSRLADDLQSPAALQDAFLDLKDLFFGKEPLVSPEVYQAVRDLKVKTAWACVPARQSWALVVSDEGLKAPRWTLWRPGRVTSDLGEIVPFLRTVLPPPEPAVGPGTGAAVAPGSTSAPPADWMRRICREIERQELRLLPHKKRRALLVLARLVRAWDRSGQLPLEHRSALLNWASSIQPEGDLFAAQSEEAARYHLAQLARRWLELTEPLLRPLRQDWRKRRFLTWDQPEIFQALLQQPLSPAQWETLAAELQGREALERRLKAALWGLGPEQAG